MARKKRKINPLQQLPVLEIQPQKRRVYHAGGYVRLSVEDSKKPGSDTIENQKEFIHKYIEKQEDMEFCCIYCDNGQTGTNFERPEFEQLMKDVKAGDIDCIVVKDLSRFGRNYRETGNYLERIFPFLDVRFVSVTDHFDTLTAERTSEGYMIPLKNIMNEMYSRDISKKVGTAYAVRQQRGEFIGAWASYGYQKCADDPHRIEPDGETAAIVQEIFRMRLSGMSYRNIAYILNEKKIPSPSHYRYLKGFVKCERYTKILWQAQMVKKILCNQVYLGHMVQRRKKGSFYEGKRQAALPESEWAIVQNTHKAIIEEEVFHAVQQISNERKAVYWERIGKYDGLGNRPNILKRLVYCADCGRPLVRYKSVTCSGTKLSYSYICPSHAQDPGLCPRKNMHEDSLIEILWETLSSQFALADKMAGQLECFMASDKQDQIGAALKRESDSAEQALKRAQALYDSLYPMYVDKTITEQEYMQMKQDYRNKIKQAEEALRAVEEAEKERASQTEKNPWLEACRLFRGQEGLTEEMAHTMISRVEIHSNNQISIILRWRDEYQQLVQFLEAEEKGDI